MTTEPAPPSVVLVNGASTFLGCFLVSRLAQNQNISRVVAIDSRVPTKDMLRRMGRAEFHRVDIRRTSIAKVLGEIGADTVVHAATSVMDTAPHSPAIKETNVVGAMQVFAACQRAESVKRVVLRSSGMVYGSSASDPSHFTEDSRGAEPRSGYGRDLIDIENYARGLGRRRPDVAVTILRTTAILGPHVPTRMGRYFSSAVIPTVIGHDPRLQFLHEEDALAALEWATLRGVAGTFNVAADGVMSLTQCIRRLGQIALPVPSGMLSSIGTAFRGVQITRMHRDQSRYLTYGRVLDNRQMRASLGFEPKFTSEETLDDFIRRGGVSPTIPAQVWHSAESWVAARALGSRV